MTITLSHWINNSPFTSNNNLLPIYNPASGEVTHQVPVADQSVIDQAINAATKAFPTWTNTPISKRAKFFFQYKTLIEKNINELAKLISSQHGKLIDDAKGSIQRGLEVVELACGAPYLMRGWFSENVATDMDSYTVRQSLGICVGITPFNFPAMIPLWMFPMALVCGNTFILKPSEKDPSCPLRLVELAHEAGLPEGVLNLVHGDKSTVDALITHPKVAAISFVGSSPVAAHIQQTGIQHGKRVQAFGSAKNHAVVLADADLEQAAQAIAGAAFGSAGERCMALSVAIAVGEKTAKELNEKLITHTEKVRLGTLDQANCDMGPLFSAAHRDKVKNYIDIGTQEGAHLLVDGRKVNPPNNYEKGFFLGASLFSNVQTNMKIYQEEIFGPVLLTMQVPTLEAAVTLINENAYGNGTCLFTRDGESARYFAQQVQVGMVGINVPIPVPVAFHSFGGWKRSAFADVQLHGSESVQFYTKLKTVTTRWPANPQQNKFHMPTHD